MKYTIITINFNHAEGLRRTIESVVNQTCKDYEYIVIDGGSTDGSVDVIKEYADKIDFWVSEPDNGIYNAMNKGIDHAHGEYLNFMNSGDCFYAPTVLEEVKPQLTADICLGKTKERGVITGLEGDTITLMTLLHHVLCHQSLFIASPLQKQIKYNEDYKIIADWGFLIKALIKNNATFHNMDIIVCDFESDGISYLNHDKVMDEKRKALKQLIPERIVDDYMYYIDKSSPMLDLIPSFNKTWRLHRLICWVVAKLVKIYETTRNFSRKRQ